MLEMSCLFKYLSGKRTEDFTFLNFPSVCSWERNNFRLSVQLFLSKNISFVTFGCVSQGLLVGLLGSTYNCFIILFLYEGRIFPNLINWLDRNQRRITEFACICQFEFWQANYLATVPFNRQNARCVWLGQSSEFLVAYAIQKSFTLNSSLAYQLRQWFIGQFHSVHYCRELNSRVMNELLMNRKLNEHFSQFFNFFVKQTVHVWIIILPDYFAGIWLDLSAVVLGGG